MAAEKISAAIRQLLDQCYQSTAPTACISVYTERLADDPEWTMDEITTVRSAVVKVLAAISRA
jgi:hypothetical protein